MAFGPTKVALLVAITTMASCHLAGGLGDLEFGPDGQTTTTASGGTGGGGSTSTSTGTGTATGSNTGTATGQGGTAGQGGGGGQAPCVLPISDDFNGTTLDASRWSATGDTGYVMDVEGGVAFIDTAPDPVVATSGYVDSVGSFDLTDCTVWIEMVSGLDAAATAEAQFDFRWDSSNEAEIEIESAGYVHFDIEEGGVHVAETTIPYDANAHRWARFREAAGTLYLETAPDGVTWTVQLSAATPAWITDGYVRFRAWVDLTTAVAGRAEFDNLNLVP